MHLHCPAPLPFVLGDQCIKFCGKRPQDKSYTCQKAPSLATAHQSGCCHFVLPNHVGKQTDRQAAKFGPARSMLSHALVEFMHSVIVQKWSCSTGRAHTQRWQHNCVVTLVHFLTPTPALLMHPWIMATVVHAEVNNAQRSLLCTVAICVNITFNRSVQ